MVQSITQNYSVLSLPFEGLPGSLNEESFAQTRQKAIDAIAEEQSRHRSSFLKDPDSSQIQLNRPGGNQDSIQIWKLLPAIQHLPEEMLSKMSVAMLFQLNSALAKESKLASKLGPAAKLASNMQQLQQSPSVVNSGLDDRKNKIHTSRFTLGGLCCSNQEAWLQAKGSLSQEGVVAIGCYDMDSIGCGGCVTPKGWLELHNPGSIELKLKHFYMPNVGSCASTGKRVSVEDGSDAINIGDNMKEIADMEGFRSALNAAREAMTSALPWNRSISAILGFMNNNNYCQADLQGNGCRASILTEFVDYIFSRNAMNWSNNQAFLTTDELSHVWSTWKGKRAFSIMASASDKGNREKPAKTAKKEKDDICRKYNTPQGCPAKEEDCRTVFGLKLRHVCSSFLAGQKGKKCEKNHTRMEHK